MKETLGIPHHSNASRADLNQTPPDRFGGMRLRFLTYNVSIVQCLPNPFVSLVLLPV